MITVRLKWPNAHKNTIKRGNVAVYEDLCLAPRASLKAKREQCSEESGYTALRSGLSSAHSAGVHPYWGGLNGGFA